MYSLLEKVDFHCHVSLLEGNLQSAINLGLFRHFSANIPPFRFPEFLGHHWFVIHAVGGRQELWKNVPGTHGQKGSTFMDFSQFSENIFQRPQKTKTNLSCDSWLLKEKRTQEIMNKYFYMFWMLLRGSVSLEPFFKVISCFNGGALGEQWSVARRQILHLSRGDKLEIHSLKLGAHPWSTPQAIPLAHYERNPFIAGW